MQLVNLNNSYFLKQNDTATQIKLGVLDYEGNPFPLDTAEKVEVVIGVEEGRVLVKEATLLPGIGEIEFGLDEGDLLPVGDNRLEVHIYTSNGEKHVVPSKGYYKLRVQKAIDDLDVQVTTYTLDYFLDQVNKITEGLPETIKEAQRLTEQMQMDLDEVSQLKTDAQEAARLSYEARDVANQIVDDMSTVKTDAENATANANLAATNATNAANNANVAADNANSAAERANNEADYAKLQGDYAKAQGDYAKAQAELIDDILEQGSVVAVNGKTGNVTLTAEDVGAIPTSEKGVAGGVARLNEEGKVVDASGNEVEGKVKSVNGMIGDVVGLETVEGATQKANQAEANAKAYTDQQIQLVTETGIPKLVRYEYTLYPTTENQTTFEIPLDTFDVETDSEVVVKNTVTLDPNEDYTIEGKNIVLNEPVPLNTRLTVFIYKNVPIGEEGAINGAVLANGTIAFEKLDEATKNLINNKVNRDELISLEQTVNEQLADIADVQNKIGILNKNVVIVTGATEEVTNDSALLQDAFNKVSNGGKLIITEGRYKIDQTVTGILVSNADAHIEIEGRGNVVLIPTTKMTSISVKSDTQGVYKGYITIKGIEIDGSQAGTYYDEPSGGIGISVVNAKSVTIEKNHIHDLYGAGVYVVRCEMPPIIKNNKIINVWGLNPNTDTNGAYDNYGDGVYIAYVKQAKVEHNYIYNDLNVTNNYGRAGIVFEYDTEQCIAKYNRVHGYDRNIHIEASKGNHEIRFNKITGSDLGIITSYNTAPSIIENNIITNEGAVTGLRNIIAPRALIYVYGGNVGDNGYIIRKNHVKLFESYKKSNLFLSHRDGFVIEDNTFECETTRTSFNLFNRSNYTVKRNKFIKVDEIVISGGTGSIFENNDMDINQIRYENTSKPGNTFRKNKIYNSDGLLGSILGYNAYGNFIENEISDWSISLITNDGTTGGEFSGNILKRTQSSASTSLFRYAPFNRRPYYCRQPNTFIDSVSGTTTYLIPYGEPFMDNGRRVMDGTAPPTTGTWNVNDIVRNLNPSPGGYLGWVCVESGTPGTWKGYGLIEA